MFNQRLLYREVKPAGDIVAYCRLEGVDPLSMNTKRTPGKEEVIFNNRKVKMLKRSEASNRMSDWLASVMKYLRGDKQPT